FFPLPPGFNHEVRTLLFDSATNTLYAGGAFWQLANGQPMNYVSKWNGSNWDSIGHGIFGNVYAMTKYNNSIYAGGTFVIKDSLGNFVFGDLCEWNGNAWVLPQGGGSNGVVWALKSVGNDLYVGGNFDSVGGIYAKSFARFDGTNWHSYPPLNVVSAIESYNGEIYVGGDFNLGGNKKDIVKWNGTAWAPVGSGFSGPNSWVNCMTVYQNELYVGGYFFTSQGDPGNNIASWNGTNWSQPGTGVFPWNVLGMHVFKNELYIGGQITDAGGIPVTGIAKWNGSNWSSLGSNFDNNSTCFASHGNDLYVGGGFWTIDGDSTIRIARYSPPLGIEESTWNTSGLSILPNPNNGNFSLTSLFYTIESIRLFDLSGSVIFSKDEILRNSYECKLSPLDGIYIAEVLMNGKAYWSKIVITR
ncbi:MAG TPA: T9SS type A sorting domain-containing protein, partial [Bacteroidia bacterium]|nr:T9SS type A sorting domain-containing protein [Bacteroidia bacterium]